jgi:hypothetical protein
MFTDMFDAIDNGKQAAETFYDGYIVNAILDAAYLSAKTKKWEPVIIDDWRGDDLVETGTEQISFDENYYLIKEEILPGGEKALILKNKTTGEIVSRHQ